MKECCFNCKYRLESNSDKRNTCDLNDHLIDNIETEVCEIFTEFEDDGDRDVRPTRIEDIYKPIQSITILYSDFSFDTLVAALRQKLDTLQENLVADSEKQTLSYKSDEVSFLLKLQGKTISTDECNDITQLIFKHLLNVYGGSALFNDGLKVVCERDLHNRLRLHIGYCQISNTEIEVGVDEDFSDVLDTLDVINFGSFTDHSRGYDCNCTFDCFSSSSEIGDIPNYNKRELDQILDFVYGEDLDFRCGECV